MKIKEKLHLKRERKLGYLEYQFSKIKERKLINAEEKNATDMLKFDASLHS